MEEKKKTLFIAVDNQKGGVGKSTITTVMASYLHHELQKKVAVIDCDYPQYSIYQMRKDDEKTIYRSPALKQALLKQFEQSNRKAYTIIKTTPEYGIIEALKLIELSNNELDIVFFDLPGTVNGAGILNLIINLDYIFVPIISDKNTLRSSMTYLLSVRSLIRNTQTDFPLKNIYTFWNKVDKREHLELYNMFNTLLKEEGFDLLKTELPESKRFSRELSTERKFAFRSTMFPPNKALLKNSKTLELITEIINIINL